MIDYFNRLYSYNHWANKRAYSALATAGQPPGAALKLLGHILAAEQIWHARLTEQSTAGMVIFPEITLDECAARMLQCHEAWHAYLGGQTVETLQESVRYQNTKGVGFATAVSDILAHVVNHGSYHRGQIAQQLRQAGKQPPVTDYIAFVREI